MSRSINIEGVKQKASRAMSQDGLEKILAGIVLILFPLILIDMIFLAVLLAMAILSLILKGILRRKFIYNRTGYAKFSINSDRKEVLFTGLYLLIFLSLFFAVSIIELKTFTPLIVVIIPTGALFTIAHCRTKIRIDYAMSFFVFVSGIIGLIFTSSGYDPNTVSAFQWGGLGAVFLVVGIVQLRSFLHRYPLPDGKTCDASSK
ncbi:hypothetical protein AMJ83_08550 [candidate division WOR_3 bacterium SM23_42]|uniref:Uncharacterized protein n=1 Tax=candidate division WOR_3 bacterium SM23_42 TaxID=1703779 RepID=A0A0S8FSK6_UNCW3|nr:MAG: hypothetical protein AMJ83_08550 [candidate division WOR_3 bacterium SM23_42]